MLYSRSYQRGRFFQSLRFVKASLRAERRLASFSKMLPLGTVLFGSIFKNATIGDGSVLYRCHWGRFSLVLFLILVTFRYWIAGCWGGLLFYVDGYCCGGTGINCVECICYIMGCNQSVIYIYTVVSATSVSY